MSFCALACSTVPEIKDPKPVASKPIWEEAQPGLCLALSGGGIRSGATSLGVLQALNDRGVLRKVNIVSTVSGGGYPVFGLIAAKYNDPSATLDGMLGDKGTYTQTVENEQFITDFDGFFTGVLAGGRAILNLAGRALGPTPDLEADSAGTFVYAMEIAYTFGGVSPLVAGRIPLSKSDALRKDLGLPYWIIQASASTGIGPPPTSHKYEFEHVFELSPDWIGSDSSGYMKSYISNLSLMGSMTASAAAVDTPRSNDDDFVVPDWAKKLGFGLGTGIYLQTGDPLYFTDGGFIENQAVIPLLRRHCKTILALDATHDPSGAMRGWSNVARYMQSKSWLVTVPSYAGGANGTVRDDAWHLPSHLYVMAGTDPTGVESRIVALKLGIVPTSVPQYPSAVQRFWHDQVDEWKEPKCNGRKKLKQRCTFPQQATVTQNFRPEETRAYRCLGYYMAADFLSSSLAGPYQVSGLAPPRHDCQAR